MANVLTTGALFFAPNRKPSFFARLLRAYVELNQRRADRVVENPATGPKYRSAGRCDPTVEDVAAHALAWREPH